MKTRFYQYRNFKRSYLVTKQADDTIILRIFNINQDRVFKCNIPADIFANAFQRGRLNMPLITKNLPSEYRIAAQYGKDIFSQPFYRQLLENIAEYAVEIFSGKLFIDPITKNVLKDPVIDSMGHTFERQVIERWKRHSPVCPLGRHRLTSLVENRLVKKIIDVVKHSKIPTIPHYKEPVIDEYGHTHEKGQKIMGKVIDGKKVQTVVPNRMIKDFLNAKIALIPNFALFKERNPTYASRWIEKALCYEKSAKYAHALECYAHALKYMNSWQIYSNVPKLFEKMDAYDKAALAYLYLAKYQLDAGAVEQAIDTFKFYENSASCPIDINPILIGLYLFTNRSQQAVDLLTKAFKGQYFNKTLTPYSDILEQNILQIPYEKLASLVASPEEKQHILYKEILDGFLTKERSGPANLAKNGCFIGADGFLNKLVYLELCERLGMDIEPKMVQVAHALEREHLFKEMLMVYKMIPKSKYSALDLRNLFYGYSILGKEKAVSYLLQCTKAMDDCTKLAFARDLLNMEWRKEARIVYEMIPKSKYRVRDFENIYNIYMKLGKEEKALEYLLQWAKAMGDKKWDFFHCDLTIAGINILFDNMPSKLEELNFICCDSNMFIHRIPDLPKTLRSLSMRSCGIGCKAIKIVAQHLPATLERLYLDKNAIGDEGAKALAQNLPAKLLLLRLLGNRIKTAGILALASSIGERHKIFVDLRRNFISDIVKCKIAELRKHNRVYRYFAVEYF